MRFWWDIESENWRADLRELLRKLSREKCTLSMMERRLQLNQPTITASYEAMEGGRSGPGDPTGRFVASQEELSLKIKELHIHIADMDDAISSMPPHYQKFIKQRYFNLLGRDTVIEELDLTGESGFETMDGNCLDLLKESLLQIPLFSEPKENQGK